MNVIVRNRGGRREARKSVKELLIVNIKEAKWDSGTRCENSCERPTSQGLCAQTCSASEPRHRPDRRNHKTIADVVIGVTPIEFRIDYRGVAEASVPRS